MTGQSAAERDHLKKDRDSWKRLAFSNNARCDRLVKVNAGLVKVLAHLLEFADSTGQGCAKQVENARAVLNEARQS